MIKLIQQNVGRKIALGVSGNERNINKFILALLNAGLISTYRHSKHSYDGLHLGCPESFQYVLIRPDALLAYYKGIVRESFTPDCESFTLELYLDKQAQSMVDAIPCESFLDVPTGGADKGKSRESEDYYKGAKTEIRELALAYVPQGIDAYGRIY